MRCVRLYLRLLALGPVRLVVLVSPLFDCIHPVLLKGFREAFVFDLVLFVYVFLVLCSKDVCLGLSVFQSMQKQKIWEMGTAMKSTIYISILQRILQVDKIEEDWNKLHVWGRL